MGKSLALLILLVLSVVLTSSSQIDQFAEWKSQYKRKFNTEVEDLVRRSVFKSNKQHMDRHNAKANKSHTYGINRFTGYTEEENQRMICKLQNPDQLVAFTDELPLLSATTAPLPASINWTAKGVITPVRDQGICGSCWAFTGVAALQAQYKISKGTLMLFSDQFAVDCTNNSFGCDGGRPEYVVSMVMNRGIVGILDYAAYTATQKACNVSSKATLYKLATSSSPYTFYKNITATSIKGLLVNKPLMIAVYASNYWFSYRSGVLNTCGTFSRTNHAVLLVGYDTSGNWIIKNSWGVGWGDRGYIRLAPKVLCGMNTSTSIINVNFV